MHSLRAKIAKRGDIAQLIECFHGMEEVEGLSPSISTRIDSMKPDSSNHLLEIAGWIGVIFVLGSYYLLATGIIDGNTWPYHSLVLVGSVFVASISLKRRALQPAVLNICFALMAIVALIRLALA